MTYEVHVSKPTAGNPKVEVAVSGSIDAAQLGALVQKVSTSKVVYTAAGLKYCGGCKSGLDINIIDKYQQVVNVEAEG